MYPLPENSHLYEKCCLQKEHSSTLKMQSFTGKPQNKVNDLSWYHLFQQRFHFMSQIWKNDIKGVFKCVENKVQFNVQN